jgi:putative endonuclease
LSDTTYSLYMLRCADDSLYTGIATDVARRLREHRDGKRGARYLRGRAPFEVVFQHDAGDRSSAQRLEYQVKRLCKQDKEALVRGSALLRELLPQLEGSAADA